MNLVLNLPHIQENSFFTVHIKFRRYEGDLLNHKKMWQTTSLTKFKSKILPPTLQN